VEAINESKKQPELLINSSAVGYYGDRGDEIMTEDSEPGQGFLSDVCLKWEQEARAARIRTVILRTGVVLHPGGGVLKKMLSPFRAGLGGAVGDGRQWMSWIDINDLVSIIIEAIKDSNLKDAVNAVADPVRNKDFGRELAASFHKKANFSVPAWLLKIALGEMSNLLLQSQRVEALRLKKNHFNFKHPTLRSCLDNYFGPR
jgi:uncharacterized protein (TIGR01777 family)